MRYWKPVKGIVVLLLTCTLAGCATPEANGPALVGGGTGEICTPIRDGKMMLMGDLLQVTDSKGVTLDFARLREEQNLRIKSGWVVALEGIDQPYISMGTMEDSPLASELWNSKRPLGDYQVPPNGLVNVVLEIEVLDPRAEASTAGMSIEYSNGSKRFVTNGQMSYKFATKSCVQN